MTVAELIEILSQVDPTLTVHMAMNGEYEGDVDADYVAVRDGALWIDDSHPAT